MNFINANVKQANQKKELLLPKKDCDKRIDELKLYKENKHTIPPSANTRTKSSNC